MTEPAAPLTRVVQRRAPSMQDVAEIAGVSHQTVSRVLNGHASIRPETRERVEAAIAELGYRRNLAARTLATSRSRSIGVLSPAVPQFGVTSSLLAVEAAIREAGYQPLVTAAAVEHGASVDALEFLLDQSIEALVVIAPHESVTRAIDELKIDLPLVALQAPDGVIGQAIGVDHSSGTRLATEHLVALGHRRIQHVSGPAHYFEAASRRAGFEDAVRDAALEPLPIIEGDWTAVGGDSAAASLSPGVTAVVCANDQTAIGLMAGLEAQGLRVPDDVSVTGFDDIPEAPYLRPALTTVRQDFEAIGRAAVDALVRRLAGSEPAAVERLRAELVVRASTTAPRT